MYGKKILICGLPGSGKTTLARRLASELNAPHFNADIVRGTLNDWDFSPAGRIRQANRMSVICNVVAESGADVIADFVCPTADTRAQFSADFTVWCDTITKEACRFPDTAAIFEKPLDADCRVRAFSRMDAALMGIVEVLRPFDWQVPTALFVGRFQPFHDGHFALVNEGIRRIGQACIAVRTRKISETDPYSFAQVRERIVAVMSQREISRKVFDVIPVPNIGAIFYGRDVGYGVERIELPRAIEEISGTQLRGKL